ncbi:hypothetical protein COCCADRAFT_84814 [Bipolaris zeicola 26-R-13]|uniref:Uncharacterized protein n=1 Tax=Cochliobolus carbonum (strain 26-R-13) TaxID=930089 RepID=W6YE66_COCC2|nr:uncharacterized protein COCCADRAFT_84814 [Bipolaris zeicola 26-R-13]EUC37777.1 hypothetical protein COCCADRAFT_84814 [Bipolaris zeicola 26-R-13]
MGGKVSQSEEFGCHGWFTNGHVVDVIFFYCFCQCYCTSEVTIACFFEREK